MLAPNKKRGKRMVGGQQDAPQDLLRHLEEVTGRQFRTRDDVTRYVKEAALEKQAALERSASKWRTAKQTVLLASLALAFIQYYLIDTLYQIVNLNQITVFVPVREIRSALELALIIS